MKNAKTGLVLIFLSQHICSNGRELQASVRQLQEVLKSRLGLDLSVIYVRQLIRGLVGQGIIRRERRDQVNGHRGNQAQANRYELVDLEKTLQYLNVPVKYKRERP